MLCLAAVLQATPRNVIGKYQPGKRGVVGLGVEIRRLNMCLLCQMKYEQQTMEAMRRRVSVVSSKITVIRLGQYKVHTISRDGSFLRASTAGGHLVSSAKVGRRGNYAVRWMATSTQQRGRGNSGQGRRAAPASCHLKWAPCSGSYKGTH